MPKLKPERDYSQFTILDLGKVNGVTRLYEEVLGKNISPVGLALVEFATTVLKARWAILEKTYADADHFKAYTAFYAHSFSNVSKDSQRLHFFQRRVRRRHLQAGDLAGRGYLGFVVLRPLQQRRIGRSVLTPDRTHATTHFPLVGGPFDVNLAGTTLQVTGAAFVEQDARVAACASSAIWMSTTSMARWLEKPTFHTTEITDLATAYRVGNRALPSSGLFPDQMSEALRSMGYDPVTVSTQGKDAALEHIYPYIESGISPVLLLELPLGGHAVSAVGHTFDLGQSPTAPARSSGVFKTAQWRSYQWVDKFIVHDDQRGPYRLLRFLDPDPRLLSALAKYLLHDSGVDLRTLEPRDFENWKCPILIDMRLPTFEAMGIHSQRFEIANLDGAIIPLPANIALEAPAAHFKSSQLIAAYYDALSEEVPETLYTRTYLTRSNDFKQRISQTPGLHSKVRDVYRGKPMPKWLWVTEVGFRDEALAADPVNARIRGEALLDANGNPWILDYVCLHMPLDVQANVGYLSTMMPQDERLADSMVDRATFLEADTPYEELYR